MAKKKKKRSRKNRGPKQAVAVPQVEKRVEAPPQKKATRAKKVAKAPRKQPNALQRLISETRGELRKVTWPTREEAVQLTKVVLLVTFVMSAFLGFMDWVFNKFFALLFGLFS